MESRFHARRWVLTAITLAIGGWFSFEAGLWAPENAEQEATGPDSGAGASSLVARPPTAVQIAEHGRLTLDEEALPKKGPLRVVLGLPDDARGGGEHDVWIVSVDGRRIETKAHALPGIGTGVQLDIDTAFLSPGRYMIQIDTAEKHPLHFRRYVLELK
jgi:hypothetical protein